MLLSACASFFSDASSSQLASSSASLESSPSSSSSAPREENDDALRRLWLQFERNNARVYGEAGLLGAYLGEAVYFTEEEGWITVGDQGVFSFKRGNSIAPKDFIVAGELSSFRGLARLARVGPGAFIYQEGSYRLRSMEEPFLREWFSLMEEKRPLTALEDLRLVVEEKRVEAVARFRRGDGEYPFEEVPYRIESIGDVRCQETENFLAYPPELAPRDSFDPDILAYFEKRLGRKEAIPFPQDAPVQFSDLLTERGVECRAFASSFWPAYRKQLSAEGFSSDENGGWTKIFRVNGKVQKALVQGSASTLEETLTVHIAMEPIECIGFAFVNERLNRSPFPPFPQTLYVEKTWILQDDARTLEIEIGFSTLEGAIEYFENAYIPLLEERAFFPEENQTQSSWGWSFLGEKGTVAISRGGSYGESEVAYRVLFARAALL